MSLPKIAVDFDDVLLPFHECFVKFHNQKYGTTLSHEDNVDHLNFHRIYGCEKHEIMERIARFNQEHDYLQFKPMSGSVKVLRMLSSVNHLHLLTARQRTGKVKVIPWLHHFYGQETFDKFHFVEHAITDPTRKFKFRSKGEICVQIGAEILIEDAPYHAESAAGQGVRVLMKGQPWNENFKHELVTPFEHWSQVPDMLKQL